MRFPALDFSQKRNYTATLILVFCPGDNHDFYARLDAAWDYAVAGDLSREAMVEQVSSLYSTVLCAGKGR